MSTLTDPNRPKPPSLNQPAGLLMTVEQVAQLWFGEVGTGGSASSNCQKIRRLIPETLPARPPAGSVTAGTSTVPRPSRGPPVPIPRR